jgi:hypothetical protein
MEEATADHLAALDEDTARYRAAEDALEQARTKLRDRIVRALRADIRPSEVTAHTPYDRNHIDRIRRAAGIPSRRKPRADAEQQTKTAPRSSHAQ